MSEFSTEKFVDTFIGLLKPKMDMKKLKVDRNFSHTLCGIRELRGVAIKLRFEEDLFIW